MDPHHFIIGVNSRVWYLRFQKGALQFLRTHLTSRRHQDQLFYLIHHSLVILGLLKLLENPLTPNCLNGVKLHIGESLTSSHHRAKLSYCRGFNCPRINFHYPSLNWFWPYQTYRMIDWFNPDRIFQSISFNTKSGVQLLSSSGTQEDPIMIKRVFCFDQDTNLVKNFQSTWGANLHPPLTIKRQSPISLVQITIYGGEDLSSLFLKSQNLSAGKSSSWVWAFSSASGWSSTPSRLSWISTSWTME